MKNTMTIGGQQAVITYDPDIEMFRGEFVGLNGVASPPISPALNDNTGCLSHPTQSLPA